MTIRSFPAIAETDKGKFAYSAKLQIPCIHLKALFFSICLMLEMEVREGWGARV